MSFFVFFISLLIVAQHVSGNHVPIIRSWRMRYVIALCWYVPWLQEGGQALPTNRTWPPPCSHGTYQHKAITLRSRQLLMMGTWLPETCWATIIREIKEYKNWQDGRTTCQPDLTTFLQPRHIPTQGYDITQLSAPDDGHMVARNMLRNY